MPNFSVAMLAASLRQNSINVRLARAIERYSPASLSFNWVSMEQMPFYNFDLEGDRPHAVRNFTGSIRATDAVCMVTPEYNRSIPALLKNAVDWGSKPAPENVWRDKVIAMTGASSGGIGTAVGQQHLRQILAIQGAVVMPGETYITFKTPDMIDADGVIADESVRGFIAAFGERLARLVERMSA